LSNIILAPDVAVKTIASQTAALSPLDISCFILRASDLALRRAISSSKSTACTVLQAGINLTKADIDSALSEARASYADSIGAPKIPDVRWEDVGGLQSVKKEILDTVQLPLDRPELFADGLKKRSGEL
jgi:peroxin-6